ncbi:MAG TPA: hypothetical protein VGP93_08080, partial [Polyangiaceae bacterium]|nr:hypothetical protein [Polyangiaceae bacterium]
SADREAEAWVFGCDVSLGAAYEFAGRENGALRTARGWLGLEGGYSWAASSNLSLTPKESSSAPVRTAALDLGDLALRGPFVRATVAVTY